jgi:hypothetical protein
MGQRGGIRRWRSGSVSVSVSVSVSQSVDADFDPDFDFDFDGAVEGAGLRRVPDLVLAARGVGAGRIMGRRLGR